MALARGAGNIIDGGGLAVPAYSRVYAMVQPLSGPGVAIPGGLDLNGQYLHFRYEGNLNLGARSGGNQIPSTGVPVDYMPNKIVVEFDCQSQFTLPFEGQLYLVGGSGEWKFGMFVHEVIDPQFYQPEIRTLGTLVRAGTNFTIPNNHTYLLGTNPTTSLQLGGATVVPSTVIPGVNVISGTTLTMGPTTTRILTGWKG